MVALVACETLLLVLLTVLVVGLLRSHAEILRRLGPPREERDQESGSALPGAARRAGAELGHDIAGTTLAQDAVQLGLGEGSPPTLLAFLTSGCTVCHGFWGDLRRGRPREVPEGVRVVAVAKDSSHESPSRLRELAGGEVPLVMSSEAWEAYGVPAAPYFVYVEGGQVRGEGSATGWKQIASLLRDAIDDVTYGGGGEERTEEIDRVLAAAGIAPGHPSLYPGGRPGDGGAEA